MRRSRQGNSSARLVLAALAPNLLLESGEHAGRLHSSAAPANLECPVAADPTEAKAPPAPQVRDLYGTLDAVDDPLLLVDGRGRILFRNQAAACLGDAEADASPTSLIHCDGELWACARDLLSAAFEGQPRLERKLRIAKPAGCWLISLRETQNSTLEQRRFLLIFRDITTEEKLRQDLRLNESMARSGLFLAGAAHQAKNVLFGLSATLESFQAVHAAEFTGEDPYLQNLKDGIARMEAMIRNLFDHSRPSGALHLLSAAAVVREAVCACSQLATASSVNVCSGLKGDAKVRGDMQLLVRAIENVIDNAIRHSPEGSTVTVDLDQSSNAGGWVCTTVRDHGPGFQPQDAGKLCTPFFSRRPAGTGLGLAVARRIMEEHGGKILLSNREGGGAVVVLKLPVAEATNHFQDVFSEAH